jgi:lipoprotein-anchoring transpeptidase ErfK/SrfK
MAGKPVEARRVKTERGNVKVTFPNLVLYVPSLGDSLAGEGQSVGDDNMNWRRNALLAAVVVGLAAPAGTVLAQYYPPPPGRVLPPARVPPAPDDDFSVLLEEDETIVIAPRRAPGWQEPRGQIPPEPRTSRQLPYPPDYRSPPPGFGYPEDERPVARAPAPRPEAGQPLPLGLPRLGDPEAMRPPGEVGGPAPAVLASLPPEDQPEVGQPKELPAHLRRQVIDYVTKEPAGTVIVDTASTYLYYVLGKGKAVRYGIGVGREGFTWAGQERISRMAEWPDWHPPEQMIERQPYLPRFMAGGPGNPLGARALYLGKSLYRIHGTNQPSTIGQFVSSGCIRLLNEDIEDLYSRVKVGTRIVVLPGRPPVTAARPQREADPVDDRPPLVVAPR